VLARADVASDAAQTLLRVEDLRVHFETYKGTVRAIDGVTFDIGRGEILGLVGETGCGKSVTALSTLRLLVSPPARILKGRVMFEGRDLLRTPEDEMNKIRGNRISMVFQEAMSSLNPVLPVGAQVAESVLLHQRESVCDGVLSGPAGRMARSPLRNLRSRAFRWMVRHYREKPRSALFRTLDRIPILRRWSRPLEREALRRTADTFSKVRLPEPEAMLDKFPHELSGGMQQRVALAMALVCRPALLILDEPTTALDVTIEAQILELVKALRAEYGMSVLLITHDLGIVAQTCDRVAVMYAGNVVESADVIELFSKPLHPYTTALLRAIVSPHQTGDLEVIKGSVPDLLHPPEGCRFHPRCPFAMDVCREQKPPTTIASTGHEVACFLYPEGPA
jgi:peptide/nickel transport system ATP-binding protein